MKTISMKLRIGILKYIILLFASVVFLNCESNDDIVTEEEEVVEEIEEVDDGIIRVSSIKELNAVLFKSDINVKMTPGTYKIGPDDVTSGLLPNAYIFEITGGNCNYDFTDVIFEFDSAIFRSYGSVAIRELRVVGYNNVIKNLTLNDIGDVSPTKDVVNILLDGIDNRIEGFNLSVRGSFPYGYGDIFGKDGSPVISHQKHSAILIRGERNHLKNTTIRHYAYGHGIFVQGGIDTLIEGCHLFGDEPRTTDDVLAELGTGSPADLVDFMTAWDFTLKPGWKFSLQEDGIRAYGDGAHYITGKETPTRNMRVIDCTIENFRSGVTIGFCEGDKYVDNCEAIGTESAYWVGTEGEIVNSRADVANGPIYSTAYQNDRDSQVDVTIIDSDNEVYGSHPVMYIGGNGHNVTLRSTEMNPKENMNVMVSGQNVSMRFQDESFFDDIYYKQDADNVTLSNHTVYPVVLGENSSNSILESCADVTDNGANNTVTIVSCN